MSVPASETPRHSYRDRPPHALLPPPPLRSIRDFRSSSQRTAAERDAELAKANKTLTAIQSGRLLRADQARLQDTVTEIVRETKATRDRIAQREYPFFHIAHHIYFCANESDPLTWCRVPLSSLGSAWGVVSQIPNRLQTILAPRPPIRPAPRQIAHPLRPDRAQVRTDLSDQDHPIPARVDRCVARGDA